MKNYQLYGCETSLGWISVISERDNLLHLNISDQQMGSLLPSRNWFKKNFPDYDLDIDGINKNLLDKIVKIVDDTEDVFPINLNLEVGSPFQLRVWTEIMNIPYGKTKTYKQIAEKIGSPNSFRAVGTACKNNPIAVIIPCHRVTNAKGGFSGYKWGEKVYSILKQREAEKQNV